MKRTVFFSSGMRTRLACYGLALAAMLGLGGCATPLPSYENEAQLIEEQGEPTARWQNEDGTRTLEYATQPDGTTCLMAQIDGEGRLLRRWDALGRESLAQIKPGMTKDEVARRLGAHRSEKTLADKKQEVWDWNIRHRGRGVATLFKVVFENGKVKYISRTRVYPEGEPGAYWGYPHYFYPYPYYYGPPFRPWTGHRYRWGGRGGRGHFGGGIHRGGRRH
ncbi:MAG: outer membrane protein assembly factor BamE [Azoarcus sp.]|nr:outer membrane protein assembly factor BamE [Azoarcus sp.]